MRMPRCITLFAALIGVSTLGFAQIGTSTITGRVTDSTGAVVPRVQVSIIQTATNFKYSAVTNVTGGFSIPVPPGKYRLEPELREGEKVVRDPGVIDINKSDLDANLEIVVGS